MKNSSASRKTYRIASLGLALALLSAAPVSAANTLLLQNDFEEGTVQGWAGRGGVEILTATPEAAHSGGSGLQVDGRTNGWHGPAQDVTPLLKAGQTYALSGWLKFPAGSPNGKVFLSLQHSLASGEQYEQITSAAVTAASWVKIEAQYKLREAADKLTVYFEAPDFPAQSILLDDFRIEQLPDPGPVTIEENIPSLKDVFSGDFTVGTAFENFEMNQDADKKLIAKHFGTVTPGNVLKWDSTEPQEGVFDLADSDAAVDFGVKNGQKVRGHTLVWHSQTPSWVFRDASGNRASKELLYERMRRHIETVMGRYKDAVDTWDVVNEVIDASQPDGLRRSEWYAIAGEEYIEKAFEFARQADPDAKLFINDYNTHEPAKSQALYNLVQRLKAKGVPVDGVGHQTHIRIAFPSIQDIDNSLLKFAALGVEQHITELDMGVYSNDTDRLDSFSDALKKQQADKYKALFDLLRKRKNLITNVTLWGKDDGNTWLRSFPVSRNDWPLLFDERLQAKSAYWAIVGTSVPQAPPAPAGLTASAGNAQASLSWSASAGAASYTVKRAATSGGPYTTVAAGVTGTSYTDTGLTNGTTYYYVVTAVNEAGSSPSTAPVSVTPAGTAPQPTGSLVVQYRAGNTNPADNTIAPHLNIKNTGTTAVKLSGLKVRYYFTKDGSQPLNSWVDWAQIGSAHVQRTFVTADGKGADTYVELSFADAAGSIPAGGQTGDIQLRIAKSDWSAFNEAGDYSFDASKTAYADWNKVTLYQGGSLVWGTQP
ncbi:MULTISPECIES: endo-1,4-beta-xylanase [Paenibacillus]|uniref:endo-1,4-beta-xylanase n=1 Tax=Paenibacillus TaxID=44249 RepID=UPI0022B87E13|nr:endo-1,4-beta-xylanase [Paenibacillus caseinilyticus]MCZ8520327.1 endo-1,4-beta-xylanase [Paenibacillus caseinilyticus]